jgi:DNA-binding CsgD family transcriptional regulator
MPVLIDRNAETGQISRFLAGLHLGSRVLLIEGEPGIGKTALLKEGHAAALQLGIMVLSACPVEHETMLECAGLADLLEAVPVLSIDRLPIPQRRAIRQAVLRVESRRRSADPRTTATALLTLLRSLARERPVVMVADDLQWLDPASACALSFVLRRLRHEPVGLLAAARTGWLARRPQLATDAVPAERAERLPLGPLSQDAIRELLAARAAQPPGRSLVTRLHAASGGNPRFALQLAAAAQARFPAGRHDGLDVPDSLRRVVAARIARLPRGARDILLVSSLSAEPVLPVICAAARNPASAHADLDAAVRAGLLTRADGDIAFAHPLMRSVVAQEARPSDRRAAHRRLACAVSAPDARARHLALGADGPDEPTAGVLEAAAVVAARRGTREIAGDLAGLAVTLTPLAERHSRHRRIAMEAEQRFEACDPALACSLLESVADEVAAGPARAELWRRLARYRAHCGKPPAAWAGTLERALDEAGDDTALRAAIMMDQAAAARDRGDLSEAFRFIGPVLDFATQAGDTALEARCCAELAFVTFLLGRCLRPDLISRALADPGPSPGLTAELRPGVLVGHLRKWAGDLGGARVLYQREHARAVAQGAGAGLPLVLWALAENEAWAGNWPRAEQLTADGCRLAEDSGSPVGIAFMSAIRGLLHAYRGRISAGAADTARAIQLAGDLGMPLLAVMSAQALGVAALSAGDACGAHEQLRPFAETMVVGLAEPALCRFLPDEIEALTRLGDLRRARSLLHPFEARSAETGREWGMAVAGRCRGLLLCAEGNLAGAEEAVAAALVRHQRLPMPFEEARTLLAAGEIHRRGRRKGKALVYLHAARVIFERLGAPRWQERVEDELARVGISAARPGAGLVLTAAEQRVANLVAAGRTNGEIAAELFMGLRTVEAHLSRVYRKLGVRSRVELCRALVSPGSPRAS